MDITYNPENITKSELRKVQSIHGNTSFVLVLPKEFANALNISKGDYVKCKVTENQLIVEKAEF